MISAETDPGIAILDTLRALSNAGDRRAVGARLNEISPAVGGRLGQLVDIAASLLSGGAASDIPSGTVDAIVSVALQGVSESLQGRPLDDDSIDAHRCALEALKAIPGLDGEPVFGIEEMEIVEREPNTEPPPADLVAAFQTEARELLSTCEESLLLLESEPSDKAAIAAIFRALHSFKGNCGFLGFQRMEQLSHRAESLLVLIKEGRLPVTSSAISALLATVDALGQAVESVPSPALPKLDELLAALDSAIRGEPGPETHRAPPARLPAPAAVPAPAAAPAAAPVPAPGPAKAAESTQVVEEGDTKKNKLEGTLRVDVGKVDQLLDLVGELIIASTAVRHIPSASSDSEALGRASAQLDRVVRSLQDVAMSLRMVPVGPTFRRMQRVVRDLSQKLGKTLDLQLFGEETEIDKTVAELVADPLVHLVRNAIDHGIEPPDDRAAAGKPKTGTIRLSGANVGGEVWIRIEDDGRGLDRQKILARAVEKGLVAGEHADRMSDADVYALIFEPGFSTAAMVTDVSGRGVGMDVVKRNIELVNGRVDIKSTPGQGALFTLRIPLTLAIIEGMLVRVGEATFTVPLLCIRESVVVKQADITVLSTWQEMVRIRGELLPVLRLHRFYNLPYEREQLHEGILVVVEDGGKPLCLFVDELIGQRQTVIKAISGYLGTIRGIAGCTVLGDGRISLILDVGALVRCADGVG